MMKYLSLLSVLLLLFISCDPYEQDSYKEYVVVEAFAVANDSLPVVTVSKTGSVDEVYNPAESVLSNANVQVVLLDENGNDQQVFDYIFSSEDGFAGAYVPLDTNHRVLPRRTYRLDVSFNDRTEIIQATTTVPDEFHIINTIPESIVYQGDEQLELTLSKTEKTQPQNVFIFSAIALDPTLNNLTPFYRASVDDDGEVSDFENNSSGLINEGNFDENPDGTITLRYPWLGIAFYGETLLITHSVDKNINDLVRSQQVQLGGSTLSPGEIPNLIYNTEGGIGIFGSLSTDTVATNFLRSPS